MAESHLRMARVGGAQGLGFDIEPPPANSTPPPGVLTTKQSVDLSKKAPPREDGEDADDVKWEGKDQIRAATLERLVHIICFSI
jgi:hypothetical protein